MKIFTLLFCLVTHAQILTGLFTEGHKKYLEQKQYINAVGANEKSFSYQNFYVLEHNQWVNRKQIIKGNDFKFTGEGVHVAIIDTGVNQNSSWLKSNLNYQNYNYPNAYNPQYGNGINYVLRNVYPHDDEGHGTHVAGLVKLVAPRVKISAYKVFSKDGETSQSVIRTAIRDAAKNGAQIINLSLGGMADDVSARVWDDLLDHESAFMKRVTLVISSGNYFKNNDFVSVYPANVKSPNAVTVCAHDKNYNLASFSHYGKQEVDICTYGVDVYSLALDGESFIPMSGTSMAAPLITGALALLLQANPSLTPPQLKWLLWRSAKRQGISSLIKEQTIVQGVLDVNAALDLIYGTSL